MLRTLALGFMAVAPGLAQTARLDALAGEAKSRYGARAGVLVLDQASGRVLYHQRALEVFAPASNMKVLTVAAALHAMGPDHEVRTRFELVDGHLVVTGGGDAEMRHGGTAAPAQMFDEVVAGLQRRGVDAIRSVRVNVGAFGGGNRPADWPKDQFALSYCAPGGGLVLEDGCVSVRLTKGGAGVRAAVTGAYAGTPVNGSIKFGKGVWGLRDDGDQVYVWGKVRSAGLPIEGTATVKDPVARFERSLQGALRAGGIRIDAEASPADAEVFVQRTSWRPTLARALEDSSNFAAEQALRILGHQSSGDGSIDGGLRALGKTLQSMVGEADAATRLRDGSGLSRTNRISPALLAATLREVGNSPHGVFFRGALPLAGRTGSLTKRFRGTALEGKVQAKTGWIAGASSLAGYVPGPDGKTYVFAILMNYDRKAGGRNKHLKRIQEQMCLAMTKLP